MSQKMPWGHVPITRNVTVNGEAMEVTFPFNSDLLHWGGPVVKEFLEKDAQSAVARACEQRWGRGTLITRGPDAYDFVALVPFKMEDLEREIRWAISEQFAARAGGFSTGHQPDPSPFATHPEPS